MFDLLFYGSVVLFTFFSLKFVLKTFFDKKENENTEREKTEKADLKLIGKENEIPSFVFTPLISIVLEILIIGTLITLVGFGFFNLSSSKLNIIALILIIAMSFLTSFYYSKKISIPGNYTGILTIFDRRTRVLISEGSYPSWLFENLIIGISKSPIKVSSEDESIHKWMSKGFVYLGDKMYHIWNSPEKGADGKRSQKIKCNTFNKTEIFVEASIGFRVLNTLRFVFNDDPLNEIFTRARECIKNIISNFVDTDINDIKEFLPHLIGGKTVFTVILTEENNKQNRGTIARYRDGSPVIHFPLENESDETARERIFTQFLNDTQQNRSEFTIKKIELETSLKTILSDKGCELYKVALPNVEFSKVVQEELDRVRVEAQQFTSEEATGQSILNVRKTLVDGGFDPRFAELIASKVAGTNAGTAVYINDNSGGSNKADSIAKAITKGMITSEEVKNQKSKDEE